MTRCFLHWRHVGYSHVLFRLVGPYKLVRHPLMVGFIIAFWATTRMTLGHLFFAVMTTVYIFIGVWFEERDLIAHFGEKCLDYRCKVRGLCTDSARQRSGRVICVKKPFAIADLAMAALLAWMYVSMRGPAGAPRGGA